MSSLDQERTSALPGTSAAKDEEQRAWARIVVPIYIFAVIVAMAGWLYLLGGILLLSICTFADLSASVAFR